MRFPCPCCGHRVFDESPGSDDICSVCFWQDDMVQLRWPELEGGPNRVNLVEAQRNYAVLGAIQERLIVYVRPAQLDEPLDPGWRPIDARIDSFEAVGDHGTPWPSDLTTLYWWRPTFWRRPR